MLRRLSIFLTLLLACHQCCAANLVEVYQEAQLNDPTFHQAIAQRLITKDGVPISLSAILPNLALNFGPYVKRTSNSGTSYLGPTDGITEAFYPRNVSTRGYNLQLTLTQTLFDFSKFFAVSGQVALSKAADATLNSALQDLMVRVAKAYFAVLQDEDNLKYLRASKISYKQQLNEATEQFKVGLKTRTDVDLSTASYNTTVASYIGAESQLANDKENLRVLTGKYYAHLSPLSENFPLVRPQPLDINAWTLKAQQQNWKIKASQHKLESNRQNVRQQFAGNLPTVNMDVHVARSYTNTINNYESLVNRNGPGTTTDKYLGFNVNLPIISGGSVIANTSQATHSYQLAHEELEYAVRSTINETRQSFMNILAGVHKVTADKIAIKSNISSLEGLEASYQVGMETLVNVLNQQEKVVQTQSQYAKDRYEFVINILLLKQAAGTLSFEDLRAINTWLLEKPLHKKS